MDKLWIPRIVPPDSARFGETEGALSSRGEFRSERSGSQSLVAETVREREEEAVRKFARKGWEMWLRCLVDSGVGLPGGVTSGTDDEASSISRIDSITRAKGTW